MQYPHALLSWSSPLSPNYNEGPCSLLQEKKGRRQTGLWELDQGWPKRPPFCNCMFLFATMPLITRARYRGAAGENNRQQKPGTIAWMFGCGGQQQPKPTIYAKSWAWLKAPSTHTLNSFCKKQERCSSPRAPMHSDQPELPFSAGSLFYLGYYQAGSRPTSSSTEVLLWKDLLPLTPLWMHTKQQKICFCNVVFLLGLNTLLVWKGEDSFLGFVFYSKDDPITLPQGRNQIGIQRFLQNKWLIKANNPHSFRNTGLLSQPQQTPWA